MAILEKKIQSVNPDHVATALTTGQSNFEKFMTRMLDVAKH